MFFTKKIKNKKIFQVEEEWHSNIIGEYDTYKDAFLKISELMNYKWKEKENLPPCSLCDKCTLLYKIVEYYIDNRGEYHEVKEKYIAEISEKEKKWISNINEW